MGMGGPDVLLRCIWQRAGVGSLIIVDDDTVELTNLRGRSPTLSVIWANPKWSQQNTLAALNPR